MNIVLENVRRIKEMQGRYPDKLKVIHSEDDVDSVDMDAVMKSQHKDFENSDPYMIDFVNTHLMDGKEVVVLAAGKTKVMIFAAEGLLKKSFSLDMNKDLWKDESLFQKFFYTVLLINKAVADQNWDAGLFLKYANELDDIMQEYENAYGSIGDPIFFWSFATANALFLLIGKQYDELGSTRIAYVINGYKEGLNKHVRYPSYPKIYIDKAFEHMRPFAEGRDAEWIETNRNKFTPLE